MLNMALLNYMSSLEVLFMMVEWSMIIYEGIMSLLMLILH